MADVLRGPSDAAPISAAPVFIATIGLDEVEEATG